MNIFRWNPKSLWFDKLCVFRELTLPHSFVLMRKQKSVTEEITLLLRIKKLFIGRKEYKKYITINLEMTISDVSLEILVK